MAYGHTGYNGNYNKDGMILYSNQLEESDFNPNSYIVIN